MQNFIIIVNGRQWKAGNANTVAGGGEQKYLKANIGKYYHILLLETAKKRADKQKTIQKITAVSDANIGVHGKKENLKQYVNSVGLKLTEMQRLDPFQLNFSQIQFILYEPT